MSSTEAASAPPSLSAKALACCGALSIAVHMAVGLVVALVGMLVALTIGPSTTGLAVACVFLFAAAVVTPLIARLILEAISGTEPPSPYSAVPRAKPGSSVLDDAPVADGFVGAM